MLKASHLAAGESSLGFQAGSPLELRMGREVARRRLSPRCNASMSKAGKILIGRLKVQKQQPSLPHKSVVNIYFFKVIGCCGCVCAGGLMSVITGKDKAHDENLTPVLAHSLQEVWYSCYILLIQIE